MTITRARGRRGDAAPFRGRPGILAEPSRIHPTGANTKPIPSAHNDVSKVAPPVTTIARNGQSSPHKPPVIEFHPSVLAKPALHFGSSNNSNSSPRFSRMSNQTLPSTSPVVEKAPAHGETVHTNLNPFATEFEMQSPPQKQPISFQQQQVPLEYGPNQVQMCQSGDMTGQYMASPVPYYPVQYPCIYSEEVDPMQAAIMSSGQIPNQMYQMISRNGLLQQGIAYAQDPTPSIVHTSVDKVPTPNGSVHYYSYWHNGNRVFTGPPTAQFSDFGPVHQVSVQPFAQAPMQSSLWPVANHNGLQMQVQPDQSCTYNSPLMAPRANLYRGGNRMAPRRGNQARAHPMTRYTVPIADYGAQYNQSG